MVTSDAYKALFRCNHLECISGCRVASCTFPFSAPCDVMLAMLVCATCWLYLHFYTLAYMSMHESCLPMCLPYFNTRKLWTSDPNLHLSPVDTTFCLSFCLFACFFASLLAMHIVLIRFMPFHMLFASFPSITCLLVFLSLPLHVHIWSEDTWS